MIKNEDICAEVQNGLPLYVGGDLEPAVAAEIASHLEACPACKGRERAAHDARALLVSALALSERRGPDLWPNVRAVLSEDGLIRTETARVPLRQSGFGKEEGAVARPRRSYRILSYAGAAAAALLVGLWLGRAAFQGPEKAPVGPVNLVDMPRNDIPVVPLTAQEGGLRQLKQHERPLHDGAKSYLDSPGFDGFLPGGPTQATTVGGVIPHTQ